MFSVLVLLTGATLAQAQIVNNYVRLKAGERYTIQNTEVSCNAAEPEKVPTCHAFHSDKECQKLPVGSPCHKKDGPGTCYQERIFGGAPDCACQ